MTTTPRPLTDLIGLDPNFTGGLSPEEHLRRQRCGECDDALKERDAARKELDKTRAELDDKTSEWEVTGQFMADWVKRLKRELAERTYGPALEKLARDIVGCGADDVHPEEEIAVKWSRLREVLANPATTAEPARQVCVHTHCQLGQHETVNIAEATAPITVTHGGLVPAPDTTAETGAPKATCSCKWSPVQGRIWCNPCPDAEPAAS